MTNVASDSQLDSVLDRRKQLRYRRRLKFLQASWRTLAISGLAGGLVWTASLPEWVIRHPSQVSIKGNQLLSAQTIQALLPLSYPENLIRLRPAAIAEALESRAPIDQVKITRQLFPPSLTVAVQERYPVAVIPCGSNQSCGTGNSQIAPASDNRRTNIWLLDSQGIAMPLENYPSLQSSAKLPKLAVLGMLHVDSRDLKANNQSPSLQLEQTSTTVDRQKRSQWPHLYQAVSHSPVKIFEVDWRDATNLILRTELGVVHLGPYSSKFADQLNALDRMRKLHRHLDSRQIGYINLENPERPVLQVENTAKPNHAKKPVESPH